MQSYLAKLSRSRLCYVKILYLPGRKWGKRKISLNFQRRTLIDEQRQVVLVNVANVEDAQLIAFLNNM